MVPDQGGADPDSTFKKEPDLTIKKKTGFGSDPRKTIRIRLTLRFVIKFTLPYKSQYNIYTLFSIYTEKDR